MTLPMKIKTVGDIRAAVAGSRGLMDVWLDDTARYLNYLSNACFEVSHTYIEGSTIYTVDDFSVLAGLPDSAPVKVLRESREVTLIAIGPEGENTDFSFNVET